MTAKEVVESYSIALSKGDIPTAFSYFSADAKWHQPGTISFLEQNQDSIPIQFGMRAFRGNR